MPVRCPNITASETVAIGAASVAFTTSMAVATTIVQTQLYSFVANADCWIAQGAAPTATAGSASLFVKAGTYVELDPKFGVKLAVIQDGASTGKATLTPYVVR